MLSLLAFNAIQPMLMCLGDPRERGYVDGIAIAHLDEFVDVRRLGRDVLRDFSHLLDEFPDLPVVGFDRLPQKLIPFVRHHLHSSYRVWIAWRILVGAAGLEPATLS